MGTLWSMSKATAFLGLTASEVALILFGLLLAVGAVGESKSEERRYAAHWPSAVRWHRWFTLMVNIAIAGEFIADGGIFIFSGQLQTISDWEIAGLTADAATARKEEARLNAKAQSARHAANKAKLRAGKERLARLRLEERLTRRLAPRRLPWDTFVNALKDKPKGKVLVLFHENDPEACNLALMGLSMALNAAGWQQTEFPRPIKSSDEPILSDLKGDPARTAANCNQQSGITLRVNRLESLRPVPHPKDTPFAALADALFASFGIVQGQSVQGLPDDLVQIYVGPKP